MNITFHKTDKQRLDKFLTEKYPKLSRSHWQKQIKSGQVLVNNKSISPHHFLQKDDIVSIKKTTTPIKQINQWSLDTITATQEYLIVNKPAGLTVHRAHSTSTEYTLAELLLKKFPDLKNIGEHPLRPGLVHRLDKEVSGVMVIAKNNQMFEHLKKQFQSRQIKKTYLGLVYGQMPDQTGQIDFKISRSSRNGKMVARPKSQTGKEASTAYEVIKANRHYSYLKITPHTGRTHQIRLHLSALNHPLVGEYLYLPKKLLPYKNIDRIFLHACSLGFRDLANNWQEFYCPLPLKLKKILNTLI